MANPYFRFKQFTVFHDLCAMKVGIDGVLLGAWADIQNTALTLDIGTGSGLIALMIAQRNSTALIDAIDIEEPAVHQAEFNVEQSPWHNRIKVRNISLQDFVPKTKNKYDLIVSNPPFFVNSLKAPLEERTNARHAYTLKHEELILLSKSILAPCGKICIILPVNEGESCADFAEKSGLFCSKKVYVFPKPGKQAKRILLEFCPEKKGTAVSHLTIETEIRHQYTPEFSNLAKDFYLKL